jgi:hypothetical protein
MLIVPKAVKSYGKNVRCKSRFTFLCNLLATLFTLIKINAELRTTIRVIRTLLLSQFNQNSNMSTESNTTPLSLKYIIS